MEDSHLLVVPNFLARSIIIRFSEFGSDCPNRIFVR